MTNKPSPAELRELFSYNPTTGELRWKTRLSRRAKLGMIAGASCYVENGRVSVGIRNRDYRAHRIVWAMMTGRWPTKQIDHIDENPGNNKWDNLREATKSNNMMNITRIKSNTSGLKGVCRPAGRRKWTAQIKYNGKKKHIGTYDTPEEAHAAYAAAAKIHHGEFAKY